jgi:CheY-like chemotaxis protein
MGKTLLLADDSVTIQKVVGISFASEDISLVTVDNGDDAIARARALRPDVILADVVMPGKSGYEVCEAINADPVLRHIPVLLLTGTFEAFDAERAARAGAAGHISKPFEAQALVERVKRLLANAPAPASAAPARAPQDAAPASPRPPIPAAQPAPRAPLAMPAPAAPRAAADEAFDFLDESPPAKPARAATAESKLTDPQLSDQALDFDGGDSAFAFGDDDLTSASGTSSRTSATAHTVAILPDAPPAGSDDAFALDDDAELELAVAPRGTRPETVAARSVEETDFDYEFEGVGGAARSADVAPSATVLDPIAGSEYDVSSSDLATTLPPNVTRLLEPAAAPVARLGEDPVMDLLEGDLDEGDAPLAIDPADETFDRMPSPVHATPPQAAKTVVQLAAPRSDEPAFDASWGAAAPAPSRPAPSRSSAPRPAPGAASIADPALERIAPALRAQLHETLEKIAWEAFGRAAETIIEQAVERLEKAAWEVVPRLAETLILEEIRRIKEGSEDA